MAGAAGGQAASWNASGPLEVGRVKYDGGFQDYFEGDIDDVRVYTGTLTDSQVTDLANAIPPTANG